MYGVGKREKSDDYIDREREREKETWNQSLALFVYTCYTYSNLSHDPNRNYNIVFFFSLNRQEKNVEIIDENVCYDREIETNTIYPNEESEEEKKKKNPQSTDDISS